MSTFAQINAATIATSRMPALPDSVRKNARSGAARFRAHAVRPRHRGTDAAESAMHAHEAEAYETSERHPSDSETTIAEAARRHRVPTPTTPRAEIQLRLSARWSVIGAWRLCWASRESTG